MNAYAHDDPFAPLGAGHEQRRDDRADAPDDWQPMPVPEDAPEPPARHPRLGAWSHRWAYHKRRWLARRLRLPLRDAGRQGDCARCATGGGAGASAGTGRAGPATTRGRSTGCRSCSPTRMRRSLLCEGEKSADAAAALLGPPWAAVASMNGARSPQRTDWSPLAGRDVTIWPDNDEPGRAYALEAAAPRAEGRRELGLASWTCRTRCPKAGTSPTRCPRAWRSTSRT